MTSIKELTNKIKSKRKIEILKPKISMKYVAKIIKEIGEAFDPDFAIDTNNKEAFNQMTYYFLRSDRFFGDLRKGLFLVGRYGSGKTLAFDIFDELIQFLKLDHTPFNLGFEICDVNQIVAEYEDKKDGGEGRIKKYKNLSAWVFNDLGKEMKEQNYAIHFGKKINLLEKIFAARYIKFTDFGVKTHATSNYRIEGNDGKRPFNTMYGEYIDDRMNQMFNEIIFKGYSRRK